MSHSDRRPTTTPQQGPLGLRPVVAGTICCAISALGYTGANICMRQLAEFMRGMTETDKFQWSMWIICNKELVTVAVAGPWMLYRAAKSLPVFPSRKALVALALVGLLVQLGANLPVQWAMEKVGLAVTIPVIFGVMLTTSAVLGKVLLGEHVSRRTTAALGMLLGSLVFLGLAAYAPDKLRDYAPDKLRDASSSTVIALSIMAACIAGAIYAVLTITIRRVVTGATPTSTVVVTITLMGVISLGLLSVGLMGTDKLLSTPPKQLAWMYAAGTLNLIGFVAIAKGLQLTTVVHANMLNASQVAMAALAGILFFREDPEPWLIVGVALTIVGIAWMDRPEQKDHDADQHT